MGPGVHPHIPVLRRVLELDPAPWHWVHPAEKSSSIRHLAAMHQCFQSKVAPKSDPPEDGFGFPASTETKTLLLFLLCFVFFMF